MTLLMFYRYCIYQQRCLEKVCVFTLKFCQTLLPTSRVNFILIHLHIKDVFVGT